MTTSSAPGEFITPLPGILAAALQRLLRRLQQHAETSEVPPADAFAVQLQGLGMTLIFASDDAQQIGVSATPISPTVTTISATPATLFMQTRGNPAHGRVQISGDATLVQQWQLWLRDLLGDSMADPERQLSERFGPVIGVQLHKLLQALRDWTNMAATHTAASVSEYLQEESGLLVTPDEMEQFLDQVDALSMRVQRLQARLQ